jgi:hypothetical protein
LLIARRIRIFAPVEHKQNFQRSQYRHPYVAHAPPLGVKA